MTEPTEPTESSEPTNSAGILTSASASASVLGAAPARPLRSLGFIHLVPLDRADPGRGLRDGVELFRYAEELGLDSGWVRTRHLQYGLPSPAVFFGAVAQHTERIGLGTAVIPVGHENPFRLAEDLATADALSGGRILAGLSVHPPGYGGSVDDLVHDSGWRDEDYTYGRIERLREFLDGQALREVPAYSGIGGDLDSERVEPYSPGLSDRLWYGGGSIRSAEWTGRAGLNWLVSNISTTSNGDTDFARVQRAQIDAYRAAHAAGDGARASVARVMVPTDGATPAQLSKYRAYAEARTPRTKHVHGGKTIIARDVLGSRDEIVDFIQQDLAFRAADDYVFELPFEFELADWKHILHELATNIGPALGWRPGYSAQ
ncbi:alkanesulfonate monooxygenase SsuD/methylene tetrahydromethanopterin reductase-like flavin-dependent oxidoreductase (luciferase family) [Leucobacter luti]|uniref:LLM class flavin-dependent oxidoreductase n=1 Tax=Leucobacter luti TaxID=340320 RepID=UPI001050E4DE|nr:LLM class flavin-dependent oxidoreductase [Leucobacter luti]MCW2289645.1 alkanesulfonate monooxygenase SsuD/methylene tetrahydromethanopterin reductase-like flavin-dependent oxidoreductase (luciferase family) [Leucobacter luti]TCK37816.1 alkanesulfonate monooxygenase SsuD/methylene tetrahydromethanopterin reductase-like flavin-dependent oxidoreductase (luciferase family) [Leucobacter luti]